MTLLPILLFASFSALYRLALRWRGRKALLLAGSVLALYWLQPALPIRGLDFWLPTAALALAVLGWALTAPPEARAWKANAPAALGLLGLVLAVAGTRYLSLTGLTLPAGVWITPSRPPLTGQVLAALALVGLLVFPLWRWLRPSGVSAPPKGAQSALLAAGVLLLVGLLVALKLPALTLALAAALRGLNGQDPSLAAALDIRWLGFSYLAFRLIHTLRDRQTGRLPAAYLDEYLIYMVFFPTLSAGPIDRLERFIKDLREPLPAEGAPAPPQGGTPAGLAQRFGEDFWEGGRRLLWGLFKKFALADALALFALNAQNAGQVRSAGWAWLMLYAYAWQIYLDFSGYTDIALGLGRWLGFRLPENFNAPYLKPNLTQFWNNWHMTLTQWIRGYCFNPLARWLRLKRVSAPLTVLISQLATMLLIGLWHGVTLNFALWGAWHGLGLFLHNRWSDWLKSRAERSEWLEAHPRLKAAGTVFSTLLTFHYVALGWVWFALPSLGSSWGFLRTLFGGG